ncbi:hypothetical protein HPB52_020619 [Rhipicephalus sanguineus]|uniref:Uncharacterized protein n=1 Tax=Rhipicephalus sanguineus TaxID=34632 RepID=A0A9D4PKJ0_RHISA|nr:hypothetical protein HPB52_020619 [Rhipicephalus sanguineus]
MNLADALQGGSPKHLQSLSAFLCCFHRSTLHHVVRFCPDFKDLDVRIDRKGRLHPCAVCINVFASDPDFDREFSSGPTVLLHKGLARLTCDHFALRCIRLAPRKLRANAYCLSGLELEGEHLDFTERFLLGFLSDAVSLEYLCLPSAKTLVTTMQRCPYVNCAPCYLA